MSVLDKITRVIKSYQQIMKG